MTTELNPPQMVPASDQAISKRMVAPYPAIVIRGLPSAGKTTLANRIVEVLRNRGISTAHLNADAVRSSLNSDLGFDPNSRCENARRLGSVSLLVLDNGIVPVIDFIMPTAETLNSFRQGIQNRPFALWRVNRESSFKSRFADTEAMYANTFGVDLTYSISELDEVAQQVIDQSPSLIHGSSF